MHIVFLLIINYLVSIKLQYLSLMTTFVIELFQRQSIQQIEYYYIVAD